MKRYIKRLFLIVLDSFGIGELPDAGDYGDIGSNTLRSVSTSKRLRLPNMRRMGLYNIEGVDCRDKIDTPSAAFARLAEASKGKDTTIGHWEIAGLISEQPLPTYPAGFPPDIIARLEAAFGRAILCNEPYSGTRVIADYGRQHVETGYPIVYTSADSVLQIAAHEAVIPLEQLYEYCRQARAVMCGKHGVGRIIARPFVGESPYTRTANRHDFSLEPPGVTLLDVLKQNGNDVIGVGKIHDIFAGRGLTDTHPISGNRDGMEKTIAVASRDFEGLCFVNLVDFDMLYGHRNDVEGYAGALSEFDFHLESLLPLLRDDDALMITADHGCDPATPSTDHSREYVPMLLYGKRIRPGVDLGTRASFSDIAATVQEMFGLSVQTCGESFLSFVMFGD